MKIWIDLTNSPHVNFFEQFIKELTQEGEDIIITCRDLANTKDLIDQKGWNYHIIGTHHGKNKFRKMIDFPLRVLQLVKYLKNKKINVAIVHSSFHASLAAFILGIPIIYINDNEHAKGNLISVPFATVAMFPEALENTILQFKYKSFFRNKIIFYPGVKEAIYLQYKYNGFEYSKTMQLKKKKIYIRTEPWTALYYKSDKNFIDEIITKLSEDYSIFILPRSKEQVLHYENSKLKIKLVKKPLPLKNIVDDCDIFIGAGGSMTREISILGIPTISIYREKLLEVDKYLIEKGFLYHEQDRKSVV